MVVLRNYNYEGTLYQGKITFKRIHRLILRMGKGKDELLISAPRFTTLKAIDRFVAANLPSLLKKVAKIRPPYGEGYLFLFGEMLPFEGDDKAAHKIYKRAGLPYLMERVAYYQEVMGIKEEYTVKMRNMTSRWGVNNKRAMTLTFSDTLIAYDRKTVDSVVVHELCHHFEGNHGEKFYRHVYSFFPDYKECHRHLNRREYEG